MRKTDKKIDNQLRLLLTDICELALKKFTGFSWLTHLVDYNHFPASLKIVCVFETNQHLMHFLTAKHDQQLIELMKTNLPQCGINLKKIAQHLEFDTEENCHQQDNGNWSVRFEYRKTKTSNK